MAMNRIRRDESGQAVTEYILVLTVLVMFYAALLNALDRLNFAERLAGPIVGSYARVYKYGHPQGKGFDEGTPENHPRAVIGGKVRLFINPR
jgi:hypothetical protein